MGEIVVYDNPMPESILFPLIRDYEIGCCLLPHVFFPVIQLEFTKSRAKMHAKHPMSAEVAVNGL
jgi:hypothetical protein